MKSIKIYKTVLIISFLAVNSCLAYWLQEDRFEKINVQNFEKELNQKAESAVNPDASDNGLIEFQGYKDHLVGHIFKAMLHPEYEFGETKVIRYTSEGYQDMGSVREISEEDLKHIIENDYVYLPFASMAQTNTNSFHSEYIRIGAIVTGTKDQMTAESYFDVSLGIMSYLSEGIKVVGELFFTR